MKTERKQRLAWTVEALGLLVCIGLGIFFLLRRQCQLDLILVLAWGALLLLLLPMLISAERNTAQREEKTANRRQ
ncbi:hypothetical protein ACTQ33_15135 [Candidatus Avoscillospira sp. LCP25S3_F1]|uniref:hypothetical protein n=1 Tax=Candidatus Avoscillospira sp. LCP25S3_F1 TaxID=3438825 RepID=UPI003F8F2C0B